MKKTGLVWDPLFIEHFEDSGAHPERPARLQAIYRTITETGLDIETIHLPTRMADKTDILLNHEERYFKSIKLTQNSPHNRHLDPDTVASAKSYEAAMAAAGSGIALVDAVLEGAIDNGFLLCRPPGHHSLSDCAMGFCIFNNIAIAAEHLLKRRNIGKVAVIDFDVHHGNGTQNSFYDRSDLLYLSTHQYPFFPGTGLANEIGRGKGEGYSVNIPIGWGHGDADFIPIYRDFIIPIVEEYEPEFILVSAGYDQHAKDLIGGMDQSTEGIGIICDMIVDLANRICNGRTVFFLEGGYHLEALSESVLRSVRSLAADEHTIATDVNMAKSFAKDLLAKPIEAHKKYWKCLS